MSSSCSTSEAPGDYFFQDGVRLKHYRGLGSRIEGSAAESIAFGVAGAVVDQGSVQQYVPYLLQSLRHGFQDLGVRSIPQLHESLYKGHVRFERRSISAQKEGGVHDLYTFSKQLYA